MTPTKATDKTGESRDAHTSGANGAEHAGGAEHAQESAAVEVAASVRGLSKSFKKARVLEDVSFDVGMGEAPYVRICSDFRFLSSPFSEKQTPATSTMLPMGRLARVAAP